MTSPLDNNTKLANALHQIQHKQPIPEIDFTIHKLEDGNTISTQERVIKEVRFRCSVPSPNMLLARNRASGNL